MQMMTTLNGRLDHPEEWVPEIPGDLYAEIDRIYDSFDTVLVGRTTALEMAEYWPGAETDEGEPAVARSMARKMNTTRSTSSPVRASRSSGATSSWWPPTATRPSWRSSRS